MKDKGNYNDKLLPPNWFAAQLPHDLYLDGELWSDNDASGQHITNMLNANEILWEDIKFVVFDSPDHSVRELPYMDRLAIIEQSLAETQQQHQQQQEIPTARVAQARVCNNRDVMFQFLSEVINSGGKGITLHDPLAPCLPGFARKWERKVWAVVRYCLYFFVCFLDCLLWGGATN